jgi:hypothetical protein
LSRATFPSLVHFETAVTDTPTFSANQAWLMPMAFILSLIVLATYLVIDLTLKT